MGRLFLCLLIIAGGDARVFLQSTPFGNWYAVAPDDAQARRKIAQGNPWALGVNTKGFRHATGAVRIGGRVILTDATLQRELVKKGGRILVEADE